MNDQGDTMYDQGIVSRLPVAYLGRDIACTMSRGPRPRAMSHMSPVWTWCDATSLC